MLTKHCSALAQFSCMLVHLLVLRLQSRTYMLTYAKTLIPRLESQTCRVSLIAWYCKCTCWSSRSNGPLMFLLGWPHMCCWINKSPLVLLPDIDPPTALEGESLQKKICSYGLSKKLIALYMWIDGWDLIGYLCRQGLEHLKRS